MLQVTSNHKLEAIEHLLRRAAHRHDASILTVTHVGQHLPPGSAQDAFSFCVCQPELYAGLLAADIRIAAFVPCRMAAYSVEGGVVLEAMSPMEFCRLLNRPDLAPLTAPLEALLKSVMQEAAAPVAAEAQAVAGAPRRGLGATEDQMNVRGSIPQRIDCRGTKVEDMAGTGEHDAQGG